MEDTEKENNEKKNGTQFIKSGHSGEEKEAPAEDVTTGCCCWVFTSTEAECAFADTDWLGLKQKIQNSCRITSCSNCNLHAQAFF